MGGTYTRDTGEKDKKYVAPYLLRVSAQSLLSELRGRYQGYYNLEAWIGAVCEQLCLLLFCKKLAPTQLSGPKMVKGKGKFGLNWLIGTVWLAGWVVHGDSLCT